MDNASLLTLAESWEKRARRKFVDAEHESDEFGRRLIEHGAICYFNCSQEIRALLQTSDERQDG